MVVVELDGELRGEATLGELLDLQDDGASRSHRVEPIARAHRVACLDRPVIDPDVPAGARALREGARLENAGSPEPLVDANRIHAFRQATAPAIRNVDLLKMTAPAKKRRPFLDSPHPLGFAHRGGAALWPENTLAAFRGAVDLGCRYLETDLYATRDGVLVVHHDERVDRTTNGHGLVRDHDLAELRALDAGYRFSRDGKHPFRGQGLTIPTLREVVELCPDARLNVEIKQHEPDIVSTLWDFIQEHDLCDRILVAAEHDPLVRAFRRVSMGRVATSAGRREIMRFWVASRLRLCAFMHPEYDALQVPAEHGLLTVVDAGFVRAAHRVGVQVHVWTINDPGEMRRLLDLGVDGLISDYPDRLVELQNDGIAREAVTDRRA